MNPTVFQFDGAVVRTFSDAIGEPWFNANDVCAVLGYKNPRMSVERHCRTPGVTKRDIGVVTGQKANGDDSYQQVEQTFINEGNLYRLIIKSRKPEAERFEAWVCDEVLPSIRKTGRYSHPEAQAGKSTYAKANIPTPEYVSLLKQSVELAKRKTTDTLADVAVALIRQGKSNRAEIIAMTGLQAEYVDYLMAIHRPLQPAEQKTGMGVRMWVGQNCCAIID